MNVILIFSFELDRIGLSEEEAILRTRYQERIFYGVSLKQNCHFSCVLLRLLS